MRQVSRTQVTLCINFRNGYDVYNCRYNTRQTNTFFFPVYVCVDTLLVRYNTVYNTSHGNNQCARPSRTQTTQENEKAGWSGYAGIYIPLHGYHL